ncbi:alpha/beta hydrolase [Halomonas denitrificans]|uniref:alpha/beta fold hydrolase n=1 Tax=Halomonas TaxID=2745 RepID=UPI001C944BD9|nr:MULTISPECIES: alpha/beta hydrolase [Halomonas]MBY5930824.1 alpha/beta hydrolase [Halomonas sp. DP8Y7-3]MBY5970432.1 alpha/beta hydrolase [Halomonas denitrificans]MCA0972960.1 alpha/beta hydrolase [Halomonas denitrificans]MED5293903.1 alpha/beta hydrolase [Pseudomonadota bacterium]
MDHLSLVTHRELEIAVRVFHPEAPKTVVAWHGLARHGGDFAALARELGPEWRVLAPDTPGRGLSSWSMYPANDYVYAHYMTVALAVLDHFSLDSVPWIGTSMGGLLGMLLAADPASASRIERLVLNDVGPELDPSGLTELASYFTVPHRFTRLGQLEAELRRHYAGFGIDTEDGWRQLTLESARRLPDGSWTYHYDPRIGEQFVHDTPRDTWSDWRAIRCPLMVIRGEDSTLISEDIVQRMGEAQPTLETLSVPGCGHAPMLDRPQQVDPIKAFLESTTSAQQEAVDANALPWWKRWLGIGH